MKALILIALILFCFQSCTKSVDFDQIDDAEIHANYILTQVYFNLGASDFLDENGNEIGLQLDAIQAPISGSAQKYLEKIEFTVITENDFDRAFNIEIVLFDMDQNPIYVLNPNINVLPNSSETTTIVEIPNDEIAMVFNTQYFSFIIQLLPSNDGSVILPSDTSELIFKSSVELFFNYKTE